MMHDPKNPIHLGAHSASIKIHNLLQDMGLLEGRFESVYQVMDFNCDIAEIIIDAIEEFQRDKDGLA
jgi:hypothetical protein